jgi:8-oxo-dGTP pyrophosphatase MutT (NUDIX family)
MAWVEPTQYWASMPSFHGAAGGLITAPGGKVLLVKPNYVDHWGLPGGAMDEGEDPGQAATREIHEEIGLTVTVGTLLVVDWVVPNGPRQRPLMNFIFDAGTIDDLASVIPQAGEIDDIALVDIDEAAARMSARGRPRLPAALGARESGQTALLWRPAD